MRNFKNHILNTDNQYSINDIQELNRVLFHISNLIQDSYLLYNNGSYNTSVCLSILAMEEISKAHMGNIQDCFYTKQIIFKRNYFLKNYRKKECLSTSPRIYISERLKQKMDMEKILAIMNDLQNGNMVKLRENAVYYFREDNQINIPKENISKEQAKNLLLYVIEEFDNTLIGLTDFSYEIAEKHNIIFDELE